MRDVIIIGGGLSGLAAAYQLEQYQIDYTLIEVKRRLGGSIHTVLQDGFVFDQGSFAVADTLDADWLAGLGLEESTYPLGEGVIAFQSGTGQIIEALAQKIHAPRLMRMAVSSIGELENGHCAVCLENGLLLEAKAIIVALPARYAERLFYGYITPLTEALLDYQYDTIQRVSLGFRSDDLPEKIQNPRDMAYAFIHRTDHSSRVPENHTMLQFGLRIAPQRLESPEQAVTLLREVFDLPEPITQFVGYWAEADPISCYDDKHNQWVTDIRAQLPPQIALIGSDYSLNAPCHKGVAHLGDRIWQGQQAAQRLHENRKS